MNCNKLKFGKIKTEFFILLPGILLVLLLVMSSCRKVITYHGRYKIISKKIDTSLSDSVLILGKVVSAIDTVSPRLNARVWTNELTKDTHTDNKGLYTLKLPSGTYTINCSADGGTNEFMETIKNTSFLPNEKVEIYFYLGGKIE